MNRLPKFNGKLDGLKYFTSLYFERSLAKFINIPVSKSIINHEKQLISGFHTRRIIHVKELNLCLKDNDLPLNLNYSRDLTSFGYFRPENVFSEFTGSLGNNQPFRHSSNHTKGVKNLDAHNNNTISNSAEQNTSKLSQKDRLKIVIRDYGTTVIVFHVGISLASLGVCYFLISNGVDASFVLKAIGFSESVISSKIAVGGSTFVIAYAVHKVFAPLRIAITLSATPFIVKYLRNIGFLRPPKSVKSPK